MLKARASLTGVALFSLLVREKMWKMMWVPHYCWRWDPPSLSYKSAKAVRDACAFIVTFFEKQNRTWRKRERVRIFVLFFFIDLFISS